ncbi:conserved protein of unknown function [Limnospira indica PCC 8005]|uniref:Uncharacterized protein n=1 Tax=Limnospira indica PCC 8005 TaxID=376219 RepID=A0A9P1KLI1_9CYAN|nr:conserved protein of unknown function [Limnospira indica PCC 8005]
MRKKYEDTIECPLKLYHWKQLRRSPMNMAIGRFSAVSP